MGFYMDTTNSRFIAFLNSWRATLIDNDSYQKSDKENYEKCLQLYNEIITGKNIINVDDSDFVNLFCEGGPVTAIEATTDINSSNRMEEVITSIKKEIAGYDGSINNIMLFIFIGKSTPLLMEEMPFFNNLISTFESDTQVVGASSRWKNQTFSESQCSLITHINEPNIPNLASLCPKSAHRIRNFAHKK